MSIRETAVKAFFSKTKNIEKYSENYWKVVTLAVILALTGEFTKYKDNIDKEITQAAMALTDAIKLKRNMSLRIAIAIGCNGSDVDTGTIKRYFNILWDNMDIDETFEAWKVFCRHRAGDIRNTLRSAIYDFDKRIEKLENKIISVDTNEGTSWWNIIGNKDIIEKNEDDKRKLEEEYYKSIVTMNLLIGMYISLFMASDIKYSKYSNDNLIKEGVMLAQIYVKATIIDRNNLVYILYCRVAEERLSRYNQQLLKISDLAEAAFIAITICMGKYSSEYSIDNIYNINMYDEADKWFNNNIIGQNKLYKNRDNWDIS